MALMMLLVVLKRKKKVHVGVREVDIPDGPLKTGYVGSPILLWTFYTREKMPLLLLATKACRVFLRYYILDYIDVHIFSLDLTLNPT